MKVYIIADFEGVSGIERFDTFDDGRPGDVERKRECVDYWVEDLNAAIRGAVAAGALEIVLLDNHSSGGTIPLGRIMKPAILVHGSHRPTWLPLLDGSFDALLFVGQHAMANTKSGHLCHTYSRRRITRVTLNNRDIGEIGLATGIAGFYRVPLAFLSGDDKAVEEARRLVPEVATSTVKIGLSRTSCVSMPREESVCLIRDGVEEALRQQRTSPLVLDAPLSLSVEYRWKDFWRAGAKSILRHKSGRMTGLRRLTISGSELPVLWDRLIGLR